MRELDKHLESFKKTQAQLFANYEKSMEHLRKQRPELAYKLDAIKNRASKGVEQPLELLNEVIKLANS